MTFTSWLSDGVFDPLVAVLHFVALVDEEGHVATVIDDELRAFFTGEDDGLPGAPPVFFERLALPGKDGRAGGGDAAAAWSWVEKMLQEAQRTSAPSSFSVSMSTPVWMVMCREPVMRTPARGFFGPYFSRVAMRPGISLSAMSSSLRPKSARADVFYFIVGHEVSCGFRFGVKWNKSTYQDALICSKEMPECQSGISTHWGGQRSRAMMP
jgi:hypothetical protein